MLIGYNSHGKWSTLKEIRETELERGNDFPSVEYPDDTPAIWICLKRWKALRYLLSASERDRIDERAFTEKDFELMDELHQIVILPTDFLVCGDGDGGHLLLRL